MPGSATLLSKTERYYNMCKKFIIDYQHPITGLLPSSLSDGGKEPEKSCKYAWVRDNVYSVLCLWGLTIAYRKMADMYEVSTRANELEKATVKLMRSLLHCMMKQVNKVEDFKKTQNKGSSLHAKYSIENCETVVGDYEWGHLQIDATSLYLLMLAQMINSGLNIIYNLDEVCFIQNLVYYIENAYRIPDYGIFERGDKTNHGLPELNTSSIGMAKAALQALSEFNLFGSNGGTNSVIHVQQDNISKCNAVVESMLPKESLSKEVGASLLTIISYPAFALDNIQNAQNTKNLIISKLEGKYGLCRFLRDGHKTALEDPKRLHYEVCEMKIFENIECEWPVFYIYILIDAIFIGNHQQATEYHHKIKDITIMSEDGYEMIPELYYVPLESVRDEYANPKSQKRLPTNRLPHLWSQSLYILAQLLYEDILTPGDIDPLNRHFSYMQKPELVIQILLVSQDDETYKVLQENNFKVNRHEGESVLSVFPATFLNDIYESLGSCKKMKLSGRPSRDIGTISTSIIYKTDSRFYVFTPQFMDTSLFYFTFDHQLIEDNFKCEISYLRNNWKLEGRPTIVLQVSSKLLQSKMDSVIGKLITKLSTGHYYGMRVQLGVISDFISTSCITQWDFLRGTEINELLNNMCMVVERKKRRYSNVFRRSASKIGNKSFYESFPKTDYDKRAGQPNRLSTAMSISVGEEQTDIHQQQQQQNFFIVKKDSTMKLSSESFEKKENTQQNLEILENADDIYQQAFCLFRLFLSESNTYEIVLKNGVNYGSISNLLRDLYNVAGTNKLWFLVRHAAGYLRKQADGLAQAANDLLVRQKQFTVGYQNFREDVVTTPMCPNELKDLIYDSYEGDLTSAILTQEVMIYLAMLIRTEPHLFNQMIRLRLGLIIEVAASEFAREASIPPDQASDIFLNLSPFFMKTLIYHIISGKEFRIVQRDGEYCIATLHSKISKITVSSPAGGSKESLTEPDNTSQRESIQVEPDRVGFWYRRRCLDGSLNRIPDNFFTNVWRVLNYVEGISLCGYVLDKAIIEEMTANEMKFALKVESALNNLPEPEYRQIMIEAIMVFGQMLSICPLETQLEYVIQLDRVVDKANELFLKNQSESKGDALMCCAGKDHNKRKCSKTHKLCQLFYDIAPSGEYGTMNFISQAFFDLFVTGLPYKRENPCIIS